MRARVLDLLNSQPELEKEEGGGEVEGGGTEEGGGIQGAGGRSALEESIEEGTR